VLYQHIRDDLLEGRVAFRLAAEFRRQIVEDDMSQGHGFAVFLENGVLPAGEALLL